MTPQNKVNSFNFEISKRRKSLDFSIVSNNLSLDNNDNLFKNKFDLCKFDHNFKCKEKQKNFVENFNHEYKIETKTDQIKNIKQVVRFRDILNIKSDKTYIRKEHSIELNVKDISFISSNTMDKSLFEDYDHIFYKLENIDMEYDRVKSIMREIVP
jgi:hypothetical protein